MDDYLDRFKYGDGINGYLSGTSYGNGYGYGDGSYSGNGYGNGSYGKKDGYSLNLAESIRELNNG
jgi:hypothetical protein